MVIASCETPKSPPGDYNSRLHLYNKSGVVPECETPKSPPGDYNTLLKGAYSDPGAYEKCETPKSPPGDYNTDPSLYWLNVSAIVCETPKSPPGDYNVLNVPGVNIGCRPSV